MQIAILYGTETGNAEMLAEDIAGHLSDHDVEVTNLSDVSPSDFDDGTFYIIVTSTYGDGELPASAIPFGEKMAAEKPDLSKIAFAVFGMGDSEYPETFNFGGKRIEELMTGAGASRVGERVTHDASGSDMAEDLAFSWVDDVVRIAEKAHGRGSMNAAELRERLTISWKHGEAHDLRGLDIDGPLDLTGLALCGFNLSETRFRAPVTANGARFDGLSWFGGARFDDVVDFGETLFLNDARFDGARFAQSANFQGTEFRGIARFDGARLLKGGNFSSVTSYGNFAFDAVRIDAPIEFTGAEFLGGFWADHAHFGEAADFSMTQVHGRLWLKSAQIRNQPLKDTDFDLSFGYTYK